MRTETINAGITAGSRKLTMLDYTPAGIVIAAMTFNMFLCYLNTHVFLVSTGLIMACEGLLMLSSIWYGFYRLDKVKLFWLAILGAQIFLILILSYAKHEVLLKSLRDVMIVPIFIVLGLSAYRIDLTKLLLWFSLFVLAVALFEAFFTETFLSIFNIREYYVQKGGMTDSLVTELDLFASGERPSGRFLFDLPGIHRVSSIFLEPVSLGFYAAITSIYFVSMKERISQTVYYTAIAVCFLLIWLSDARMALGTFLCVVLFRNVFVKFDHRLSAFILPSTILLAFGIDSFDLLTKTGEGLGYRIYVTVRLLSRTDIDILLGLSDFRPLTVVDSGIADLLSRQGLLGVLMYWLAPLMFMRKMTAEPRIYTYGVSVFIALGFLVSPAVFSIKTASLLWFQLGYLIARHMRDENGNYRLSESHS